MEQNSKKFKKNTNWRPIKVLFIGDKPSSKNVNPDIPFVGTYSYKRLLRWIGELDLCLDNVKLINSVQISQQLVENADSVVYLGQRAYKQTKNIEPKKFKIIDHPSPRNIKLNDSRYELKMLVELKNWLYT